MAEIFLARTTAMHGFEKMVVLKRMLPQYAESGDFIRMFLDEARLAATLAHPNIAQVYDIGEHDGQCFFTMEYVAGQDLRKLKHAARASIGLPLEHVVNIVIGVASGLHYAHEQVDRVGRPLGLVHRDVSPSNIIVTYDGGVKLVDFGIAKASTAQVATAVGTLKGKIPYMSPEQCRGAKLDRRSDIFSLGTVLWELSTGSRLFRGENEFAMLNRIANGDVPLPSSRKSNYPEDLEAIVMRALEGDREHRYATAQDLQIALEDFAREHKLSVSSAKLARFMSQLFEEEIERQKKLMTMAASTAKVTDTQRLGADDVEVLTDEALRVEADDTSAYTPSELGIQVPGTPMPDVEGTAASGFSKLSSMIRQSPPRAKIGAVAAGLAVVVGGLIALSMRGDDPEGTDTKEDASPSKAEQAPVIIVPRTPPPPEPEPAAEETKTGAPPEAEEKAAKAKKKEQPKKKKKSTSRKPKRRPKKKKKKTWDPNSPLPPPG
jgi:serine/threonine protein kinase